MSQKFVEMFLIEDGYHTRTAIDGRTAALWSTDGLDGRALIYGRAGRLCALVKFKILCDRSLEVPSTMASALVVGVWEWCHLFMH